jgi:hypothetical protein
MRSLFKKIDENRSKMYNFEETLLGLTDAMQRAK